MRGEGRGGGRGEGRGRRMGRVCREEKKEERGEGKVRALEVGERDECVSVGREMWSSNI